MGTRKQVKDESLKGVEKEQCRAVLRGSVKAGEMRAREVTQRLRGAAGRAEDPSSVLCTKPR